MRYCFLRFPEGKLKAATLSYDDGIRADIRLSETLNRYGMKGTFNINSGSLDGKDPNRLRIEEIKEHLLDHGHEIAIHGERHLAPGIVTPSVGIADALNCRTDLENIFGRIIRGMAYPDTGITKMHGGNSAEAIKAYLRDLGIAYARTLAGDNNTFMLPTDWLAWMPTAHHNNPKLMEWVEQFVGINEDNIRWSGKYPRLFYLWGHSYEFDNNQNWNVIERFCELIGGKADTWYATNIEICDYVNAYHSLIKSADGNRIYNPTLKEIWLCVDHQIYSVRSGETLVLP
ncbi:MAG: polysaccharide deacetylase family protein [Clostridia bacterium]|nr:polysaccharide deacetylase family protein [Clostridia bacterium]